MAGEILVVNAGSSSLKCAVFRHVAGKPTRIRSAVVEAMTSRTARIRFRDHERDHPWDSSARHGPLSFDEAWQSVIPFLQSANAARWSAVGHRVVHGGLEFHRATWVNQDVIDRLRLLTSLAPLHQPANLAGLEAARIQFPDVPQVACFDTAFHHGRELVHMIYALPREEYDAGVRRWGFHGLAYQSVADTLRVADGDRAGGRTVACHLGHGASVCAMNRGRSVDTSMGFTALDGLVMATRCGSMDPGAVLHLLARREGNLDRVDELLWKQSGLLGVSGISADMRELLASDAAAARLAVDLFCERLISQIGAMTATLGGLDTLVFSGGIGENSAEIRSRVGERLAFLGIRLDTDANGRSADRISHSDSEVIVLVVPADEERVIAHAAAEIVGLSS